MMTPIMTLSDDVTWWLQTPGVTLVDDVTDLCAPQSFAMWSVTSVQCLVDKDAWYKQCQTTNILLWDNFSDLFCDGWYIKASWHWQWGDIILWARGIWICANQVQLSQDKVPLICHTPVSTMIAFLGLQCPPFLNLCIPRHRGLPHIMEFTSRGSSF